MPPKLNLQGQPPIDDPLDGLLEEMGVRRGDGILTAERNIVPDSHSKSDRFNTVSNSFTSHPSSRELANMSRRDIFVSPEAGHIEEIETRDTDLTFTIRSLSMSWADLDLDAEFSADKGETKEVRNIVAAISGGEDGARYRVIVLSSPLSLVDRWLLRFLANQQFVVESVNWLIGAEDLTGTTESEEDVKIEHTKEGQTSWFYGTVLGVPLLVLGLGAVRVRIRRKPRIVSKARAASAPSAPRSRQAPVDPSDADDRDEQPGEPEHPPEDSSNESAGDKENDQ